MRNLLEVREFDKISCNPDFEREYAYLPEPVFRELVRKAGSHPGR